MDSIHGIIHWTFEFLQDSKLDLLLQQNKKIKNLQLKHKNCQKQIGTNLAGSFYLFFQTENWISFHMPPIHLHLIFENSENIVQNKLRFLRQQQTEISSSNSSQNKFDLEKFKFQVQMNRPKGMLSISDL